MKFVIFSFEQGDYLCDIDDSVLVFDSRGLALQYLQKHYHQPVPITKTKKIKHYPNYYQAPFRLRRVC